MNSTPTLDFATVRPLPLFPTASDAYRTCGKKHSYTKRAALTVRNARMRGSRFSHKRPDFLRIYSCAACGGWHLTHHEPISD